MKKWLFLCLLSLIFVEKASAQEQADVLFKAIVPEQYAYPVYLSVSCSENVIILTKENNYKQVVKLPEGRCGITSATSENYLITWDGVYQTIKSGADNKYTVAVQTDLIAEKSRLVSIEEAAALRSSSEEKKLSSSGLFEKVYFYITGDLTPTNTITMAEKTIKIVIFSLSLILILLIYLLRKE